jgi:hypothetical protein
MFSLVGLIGLLFFLYLRPQEAIPTLRELPMLNLCAALCAFGIVIDVRLQKAHLAFVPGLFWILLLFMWGFFTTAVKMGTGPAVTSINRVLIAAIVMVLLAHGVTSFRSLQVILATVLALGLSITAIGVHQAQQPFGCFRVKDAWADRELANGVYDGRPCETNGDCFKGDAEPGYEYLCEKPGLLNTASISHGRVRYRGILQDPNELSLAISIVLPFAIGFWERRRGLMRGLFALLAIGLVGLCTIYTQSRGGQLVFLTVMGTYFIRRFGFAAGFCAGVMAAVPVLLLGGRSGAEAEASAMERTEALYAGIDMLRYSPLFGVGVSGFVDHHHITAHNSYLLSAAEMGLPGMFLWTSLVYVSVKTLLVALRRYRGVPEAQVAMTWAMALLASFCGLLVGIFFLSFSYHVVLFVYLGLCAAFFQACRRHDPGFAVRYSLVEMILVFVADQGLLVLIFVYSRLKAA